MSDHGSFYNHFRRINFSFESPDAAANLVRLGKFRGQIPNQTTAEPTKVYVFEDLNAYQFWFAERNNPGVKITKINNLAGITEDKAYFLPRGFDGVKQIDFYQINDDKFYIAFRDVNWNLDKPPLKNLIEKGYQIGAPQIYKAQGMKGFSR